MTGRRFRPSRCLRVRVGLEDVCEVLENVIAEMPENLTDMLFPLALNRQRHFRTMLRRGDDGNPAVRWVRHAVDESGFNDPVDRIRH